MFESRPGSEVFGSRPGSEVFERPGSEVFEKQPDSGELFETRPGSELFHPAPEDNPRRPGSDVFREAPTVAGQVWPGSEVFGEEPTDADLLVPDDGREAADDQHDIQFEDSGVDLLNPMSDQPDAETSGGSIFDLERTEGDSSDLDVDALPMPSDAEATESIHLPTGETGPRSDLFRDPDPGTDDHDRVSFELPDRPPGDAEPSQQVSGLIDWAAPVEGAELAASEGLTESEARAAGVPDLQSLAGAATTPAPATTPGPSRRPPSTIPDMSMTERRRPGSRPDSRPGSQWMFPEPAPARSSKTGWLAGTALGLLLGAGGVGGAYLGGLLPSKESDKTPPVTQGRPATQPPTVAEAPPGSPAALLAGGDPAAALKAYEAAGEVSSPEDRAGRGQARFLARLRELAGQGTAARADDPQFQQATTDLEAVVQAAGTLETDEQKRAGALAALHLGLIKELTGDSKGAQERYRAGQKAFPAYRRMFDTALTRERLAPKAAPVKTARLTPQEAEELAQLAILGTVLLQAATGDALDDEAGFHFWEASELNSARRYKEAVAALSRAIAAHEKRRMALAGRGLNPLSDPLEQIFPRACAEIREYWVFKMHFYGHEQLGNELRQHAQKGTFPQFLSSVVTLREQAKQGGDGPKLAQVQKALDKASGELKAATAAAAKALAEKDAAAKELMTATTTATKAAAEKDAIAKDLTAAKTSLDEQTKQLADARKGLDDARAKQKAADDTLAAVVKELRANKLIGETDDAAAAVAKLPDVVRKASAAATSTDAKKAAEALVRAQQDLEAARAGTDKAEAVAKKAADEAKALRDKLDAQVKSASEAA
ncbi:MAG TPA: hypothetical protein VM597_05840, partial [Gemmataceae bacterium]|nr:hypothetical protein [Gemmataceae bacterium]